MQNTIVKQIVAELHPDLFKDDPHTLFLARCRLDRDRIQATQDFWLEFLETSNIEGILPPDYMNTWWDQADVTQHTSDYEIDVDATTKMFARIVKWARNRGYKITKEYETSQFKVVIHKDNRFKTKLEFVASREVMCRRVHVGTEVIPAKVEPEKVVDKYDWECERVAFLGIDTDD